MVHEVALRRVLYEIPGMESNQGRDGEYAGANGQRLAMRTYGSGPIVVLLAGYPDAGFEKHVGCRFMDMQWTVSMAQILAASGFTAVAHSNHEPVADAIALLRRLKEQQPRIGIWATSGHAPTALQAMPYATCAVLSTPIVSDVIPQQPIFVVRSGRDETPNLNASLDAFIAQALAANCPITLVNHPEARHSFELTHDSSTTRAILAEAISFLRVHLTVP